MAKKPSFKREASPDSQFGAAGSNIYEIVIDPDEEILYEGEMARFKPGMEKNFVTRWL